MTPRPTTPIRRSSQGGVGADRGSCATWVAACASTKGTVNGPPGLGGSDPVGAETTRAPRRRQTCGVSGDDLAHQRAPREAPPGRPSPRSAAGPVACSRRRAVVHVDRQEGLALRRPGRRPSCAGRCPRRDRCRLSSGLAARAQQHAGVADRAAADRSHAPVGVGLEVHRLPGARQQRGVVADARIAALRLDHLLELPQPGARVRGRRGPGRARPRGWATRPRASSIQAVSSSESDSRSFGPRPFRVSIALARSRGALPTARPERLVHVGDERGHLLAHAAADRDHGARPAPASPRSA